MQDPLQVPISYHRSLTADNREKEYQRQAEEDQKYGVGELTQSTDRQIEVLEYLLDHYKGDYK